LGGADVSILKTIETAVRKVPNARISAKNFWISKIVVQIGNRRKSKSNAGESSRFSGVPGGRSGRKEEATTEGEKA
jgi:hypothetical protein